MKRENREKQIQDIGTEHEGENASSGLPRSGGHSPSCGCGVESHRKAVGVDPDIKERNLKRLRRIEGQVRGLQKMVEEDRYCPDILTQISAAHEALRGVGRELMRNHLRHCATAAIRSGEDEAEETYDELIELIYRHVR